MFEAFFLAHALMDRELCLGRLLRIVWQEILYKTSRKRTHLILLLLLIVGNCYYICLQKEHSFDGSNKKKQKEVVLSLLVHIILPNYWTFLCFFLPISFIFFLYLYHQMSFPSGGKFNNNSLLLPTLWLSRVHGAIPHVVSNTALVHLSQA